MQVLGQFNANVLMHFWLAEVHVRQLVVVFGSKIYHVRWQPQARTNSQSGLVQRY